MILFRWFFDHAPSNRYRMVSRLSFGCVVYRTCDSIARWVSKRTPWSVHSRYSIDSLKHAPVTVTVRNGSKIDGWSTAKASSLLLPLRSSRMSR